MADDDWQDWQPPAAAPQAAAQDDGWQDYQPPTQQAAGADDGWQDWQPPVAQSSATPNSRPPTPEDWKNFDPDKEREQQPRGVQARATDAFKDAYHPVLDEAVKKLAPDFAKEHPIISNLLQGVLSGSPIGGLDKVMAGVMAAPSALAGAAAGLVEKNPKAMIPVGLDRMEADRLQRDLDVWGKAAMFEGGMGTAGALSHAKGVQAADIGEAGLRDIKKQGQTPGSTAAPGVAQEPNPPARQPVADAQNKTTLGTGAMETGGENLNTRDYGKTPAATGEASGVNVLKDGVDPTLAATIKPDTTAAPPPAPAGPPTAAPPEAPAAAPPPVERAPAPAGLLPEKQPFYDAAKAEAPNLPQEQLLHIANLAGGPKGAALMARNAARRMAEDAGTPAARVAEAERAPVPAGTMELPPVEVKPPGVEPPPAPAPLPGSKAAMRNEAQAAIEEFRAREAKKSGASYNLATPEGRAAKAAAEAMPAEPAAPRRPSTDYTGKLRDDISHTEYVDRLQELRDNKPRPVNKLWNNPDLAPPERVAAAKEDIKAWNSEYRAVDKNQKLALERDNAAFRAKKAAEETTPAPEKLEGTPVRLDPELAKRLIEKPELLNSEAAKRGMKPNELLADANDAIGHAAEVAAERADPGVAPQAAGAAASPPPTPAAPPPRVHTRVVDALHNAYDNFLDVGKRVIAEVQGHVAPMAKGTNETRAMVKDHADAMRRIDYEWTVADDHITKSKDQAGKPLFDQESQKRMWDAADEENVMRQRGEQSEHMGIATLEPHERALVESFQPKARALWDKAREIGMVEGEGLPYYTPRLINNVMQKAEGGRALDGMRGDISASSPNLRRRKYMEAEETEAAAKRAFGDEAELVRNIRTMPLVLAKMEKAIAGRQLINQIREAGRRAGENTVLEGKPNERGWFTIEENPAFYTYRPRYEVADTPTYRSAAEARSGVPVPEAKIPLLDRNGLPVIDRVPLYIHPDFEGPLRSIMHRPSGLLYSGFMGLKGRTMQLIMNSPAIHNMVEWGRALPTMPGKMLTMQVYFEGNAARKGVPYNGTTRHIMDWATGRLEEAPRNASPVMIEAINAGMVPIGKRFSFQDLSGMMETPELTPGRSLTAKGVGALGDLITPKLGDLARRGIDRAGDIWHNTMLWDRIADLQAGIYVNAKKDLMAKHGIDELSAQRVAAHIANRYAGALPQEAMSSAARKIANVAMFSRTFTLGNLGVMKDMLTGLPRDVKAQIIRDAGELNPKGANYIRDMARRKAIGVVAIDVAAMYVGNSLLQSAFNMMQDDGSLSKEAKGYVTRFNDAMKKVNEDPAALLQPLSVLEIAVGYSRERAG